MGLLNFLIQTPIKNDDNNNNNAYFFERRFHQLGIFVKMYFFIFKNNFTDNYVNNSSFKLKMNQVCLCQYT